MDDMVKVFSNNEFGQIRVVMIENNPWFVGKDLADALGYSNSRKALSDHVDDDDKGVTKCDTLGGSQKMAVVNESGLYSLVLSSKLDGAKRFKRWVTSEVLPSIRKHGAYMTDSVLDKVIKEPETIYELARKLVEEKEKNAYLEKRVKENQSKAEYFDAFVNADDLVGIRICGKEINVPQNTLVSFLLVKRYLYRAKDEKGTLLPIAKYEKAGYFKVKDVYPPNGKQVQQTFVTNKGKEFIRKQYEKYLNTQRLEVDKNKEN